ncbi:MAG: trans-4-hydroxy-L-proline dehydratase [Chloroflexota bacterium]
MNARVSSLRDQSVSAVPTLSVERARLVTQFYSEQREAVSVPVERALFFKYLLEHQSICINPGELIVGERGPAPAATPTYPEICCHSAQDLHTLNSRDRIKYHVDESVIEEYKADIIPFWRQRSMRERLMSLMTEEWINAFKAGVFTEFMEQRAPGHTVLDDKIYHTGMNGFKTKIQNELSNLDYFNDPTAYDKEQELRAMAICAEALIHFAHRHADLAQSMVQTESDPLRRAELKRIADVCYRVPAEPPRNMWEALQAYWFVHLGVIIELNPWDAFNPGRLDQHLQPFFQNDIDTKSLTYDQAKELLQCFWIKFNNQLAPAKVGVTAKESGTYTDFATINTGGLLVDGSDGVNEVTYLILDVIEEMRLVQPSSNIQLSKENPDRFVKRACQILKTGYGQPSIFNADLVVEELLRQGKSINDARCGGTSGCVETGAFGKENYNLTGYFNLPKVLEITLNNGLDPISGLQIGITTGDPTEWTEFSDLWSAYTKQLNYFVDIKIRGNQVIERLYSEYLPVPFLSLLIDDCITNGTDYHSGGARYNTSYIQGVGLGSITDSLSAVKHHVFDERTLSMTALLNALEDNFAQDEAMRQKLLNRTPRYGNDDDRADSIMVMVFDAFFDAVQGRPNTKGGHYEIDLLPTTVHVHFGQVMGAMPDGRKANLPLSEGVSPVQGADRHGPTAVIRSVAKMDHVRTGGTLLNMKFHPELLKSDSDLDKLVALIRTYFELDGHHIQFNVVDADTLRAAQTKPEQYRDLIVRVAGYSDYFCNLNQALQQEIITRTAHTQI